MVLWDMGSASALPPSTAFWTRSSSRATHIVVRAVRGITGRRLHLSFQSGNVGGIRDLADRGNGGEDVDVFAVVQDLVTEVQHDRGSARIEGRLGTGHDRILPQIDISRNRDGGQDADQDDDDHLHRHPRRCR